MHVFKYTITKKIYKDFSDSIHLLKTLFEAKNYRFFSHFFRKRLGVVVKVGETKVVARAIFYNSYTLSIENIINMHFYAYCMYTYGNRTNNYSC